MANWLADQARVRSDHSELTLREAARAELPTASERVEELWQRLLRLGDTERGSDAWKAAQEDFHAALMQHGALDELARSPGELQQDPRPHGSASPKGQP